MIGSRWALGWYTDDGADVLRPWFRTRRGLLRHMRGMPAYGPVTPGPMTIIRVRSVRRSRTHAA